MDNILLGIKPQITGLDKELAKADKVIKRAGEKSGRTFAEGITSGLKLASVGIGATVAAIGSAIFIGKKFADAASVQEDAVNKLNASLRQIGEFSLAASKDLQNFAAELQKTTRFGDEAIIGQLSFAQAMGATADQSKEILKAAADMSAALNIDLNSAVRNITKTLGGYAGELGEVIPELKALTQEQLRAGAGVELLSKKYLGFAQKDAQTFSGAVDQMGNAFGDLLEEIGFLITKSDSVVGVINSIKQGIIDLTNSVKISGPALKQFLVDLATATINPAAAAKSFMKLKDVLSVDVNQSLADFNTQIAGFEQKIKESESAIEGFKLAASADKGLIGNLLDSVFGDKSKIAEKEADIKRFQEKILELKRIKDILFPPEEAVPLKLLPADVNEQLTQMEIVKEQLYEMGLISEQMKNSLNDPEYLEAVMAQNDQIGMNFGSLAKQLQVQAANIKVTMGAVAKTMVTTFASGVGNAFSAFGQALANGENALKAFAKSMLSTIGGMAVQLGTSYILQGIAISANPLTPGAGGPLIAAGAALATFGGVLQAIGGGGGGNVAPSPGAGGGAQTTFSPVDQPIQTIDEERQEPSTQVQVTIHGDVLDSEESGSRIINLLNDAFDKQGVVINQAYA